MGFVCGVIRGLVAMLAMPAPVPAPQPGIRHSSTEGFLHSHKVFPFTRASRDDSAIGRLCSRTGRPRATHARRIS